MKTLLDRPRSEFEDSDHKFFDKIEEFGFHINHIMAEDGEPQFSYTTGLWLKFKAPEFIVVGAKRELAQSMLWSMHDLASKSTDLSIGSMHEDVIGGFPVAIGGVSEKRRLDHLIWADWFYEREFFDARQIILPNMEGTFPWDSDNQNFREWQYDLSDNEWRTEPRTN